MKPNPENIKALKFAALASAIMLVCSGQSGATNITGDTITSNNLYIGTATGVDLKYSPSTSDTTLAGFYSDIARESGKFYWRENGGTTAVNKMFLNTDNSLTLYNSSTGASGVIISPDLGKIDLKGTVGAGIYSGSTAILSLATASTANMSLANLTVSGDTFINGVRIGKGNGGIPTNTSLGLNTLINNTTGDNNSASGGSALALNTSGSRNTAYGAASMYSNIAGGGNTAVGAGALYFNAGVTPGTVGSNNTAVGDSAGVWFGDTGSGQMNAASYGIYIGAGTRGASANEINSIVIGATAVGKGSNTTVIGTSSTTQTYLAGQTVSNSLSVTGQAVANSLSVTGATTLNGQVTLAAPQGDISMGIYSN